MKADRAMKTGLLWFDSDPKRPLEDKVAAAVQRYLEKFGVRPDACHVNPGQLPQQETHVEGVRIVADDNVLPHHFWVGCSTARA